MERSVVRSRGCLSGENDDGAHNRSRGRRFGAGRPAYDKEVRRAMPRWKRGENRGAEAEPYGRRTRATTDNSSPGSHGVNVLRLSGCWSRRAAPEQRQPCAPDPPGACGGRRDIPSVQEQALDGVACGCQDGAMSPDQVSRLAASCGLVVRSNVALTFPRPLPSRHPGDHPVRATQHKDSPP